MNRPKLFDFVKVHESFDLLKPIFTNSDFPFEKNDFEVLEYLRDLANNDYDDLKKIYQLYNDDDLTKPGRISEWDKWGSVVEEFEFVINLWVKTRLSNFIGMDDPKKIRANISEVDCFSENDVNVWIKRSKGEDGSKPEFLGLAPYHNFFHFCKIDWPTETLWVHTTYKLIDQLEKSDRDALFSDSENWFPSD